MTHTNRPEPLVALASAVEPVRTRHRALISAATAWQAEHGRTATDPDLFALVCAGAEEATARGASPTRWTRAVVYPVVRSDIPNWCSQERCLWPDGVLTAMWEWFAFLRATGRLERGSDPVPELRKPLACYGRLDQDGRPLPDDAEREVECECFLPYRETALLLSELVHTGERTGRAPFDLLRAAVLGTAPGSFGAESFGSGSFGKGHPDPDRPDPGSWSVSGP